MNESDQKIITMLYRMVNECNANHAPMGALYSELSEMIQHGATNERVNTLMAQIDGKRRPRFLQRLILANHLKSQQR